MDRVKRAKRAEPKWDPQGVYLAQCAELARKVGLEPHVVYEEFTDRAVSRAYDCDVPNAERLAMEDVLERFKL